MAGSVYELAILLSLRDMASGGLARAEANLRATGKEGRAMLRTFEDLRGSLKKDLSVAGMGVGVLALMAKGVKVAGDFESAMADLRMSIEEVDSAGNINLNKLTGEFNQLESVGVRLGNRLPGTTQDFIQMFSTLKQGGLEAKTIIDGAGESVANLAVVTGEIPKDLAEPFAQYAQQFQLTGNEAIKLSDTLARIRFATGLRPQELIEGSKFFQLRAGMALKMTGLEGADVGGRLLATLRSYGLEGGIGGRELGGFMLSLNFNTKEKLKLINELKSTKGIDLKFFSDKGAFLGVENVFTQMEKFRRLSTQDQMKFGEKLFDREGMAIASIFMKSGVEGWNKINQRIEKVPSLQELINQKTETYNAKLEAVQGTISNLAATSFTPMLNTVKPALDLVNSLVGGLQGVAKEHPGIVGIATDFIGVTSAAATVVFGLKAGVTMIGLYRLASTVALKSVQGELLMTGAAADVAAVKIGRIDKMIAGIGKMGALKITVALAAVGAGVELIKWLYEENQKYEAELARRREQLSGTHEEAQSKGQLFGPRTREQFFQEEVRRLEFKTYGLPAGSKERELAQIDLRSRQQQLDSERSKRESQERLAKESMSVMAMLMPTFGGTGAVTLPWEDKRPGHFEEPAKPERRLLIERLQAQTALHDPNVLAKFIQEVKRGGFAEGGVKSGEEIERFLNVLKDAFAKDDTFKKANDIVALELVALSEQSQKLSKSLFDLSRPAEQLPQSFSRVADAATRLVTRFNSLDFEHSFTMSPYPQQFQPGQSFRTPIRTEPSFDSSSFNPPASRKRASGGPVHKGISYLVGERGMELFTPDSHGHITSHEKLVEISKSRTTRSDSQVAQLTNLRSDVNRYESERVQLRPDAAAAAERSVAGASPRSAPVIINYSPKVELHGNGGAGVSPEQVRSMLAEQAEELMRIVEHQLEIQLERA